MMVLSHQLTPMTAVANRLTITLSAQRYLALKQAAAQRNKTIGQLIDESLEFYGIKTDDDARERVRAAQLEHVQGWVDRYEANRERIGIDPDVDLETAVLFTWAVELGLGMLEAFDMAPASPARWAAVQRRVARGLLLADDAAQRPLPVVRSR